MTDEHVLGVESGKLAGRMPGAMGVLTPQPYALDTDQGLRGLRLSH